MRCRTHCLLFLCATTWGLLTVAGAPIPGGGEEPTTWMGEADYSDFQLAGDEKSKAEMTVVSLDTPAGTKKGFRFTVREECEDPIALMARAVTTKPLAAGDTLSAHFFMRTVNSEAESGEGKVQFILENVRTYDKSVQYPATAASEWKEFNIPFSSKSDYPPGAASVFFRLGYRRQTVEIAGFEVKDYGHSVTVASLPMTVPDLRYPGMEANARWRALADQRIDNIRKSPLIVEVAGPAGQPIAGAQVEVQQTRHAFWFGTAIGARTLLDSVSGPDTRLSDAVQQNFNIVTFENDLKWPDWEHDRQSPVLAARWCQEHNIAVRGHNMIWPAWRHLPGRLRDLQSQPGQLRQEVLHHVEDIGKSMSPYATMWDVVNEPFTNHDLMDVLGDGILTQCFRAAREAAPGAKLFINDYGIVTNNGMDHAHRTSYERTIERLLAEQAPLEGIGIQGHFGQEFTAPERILEILDRLAQFHLPLQMTEFSAQAEDREMDANLLRDVMTVFFSYPAANAFILWGFYDCKGFEHKATLYDASGQLTPAGKIYRELVFHRWWTHETLKTAADGKAQIQGFHGQYEVSVTCDGLADKRTVDLEPGGTTLKVVLGK